MQKDFEDWNKIKIELNISEKSLLFQEGEIWWCSLGINIGVEINGKNQDYERPVLVYKKINNKSLISIPLTTKIKKDKYNLSIKIKDKDTTLCLNQIKVISSKRLLRKISKISENKLRVIDDYFTDLMKNRNPLSGESQVPYGNNSTIISDTK